MLAKAIARYVRMTPRKVGYVVSPLRRRTVAEALAWLAATNRGAAKPVAKVVADEGPRWKRFRAAAFGRASRILKRTTHITVELERANDGT